MYPVVFRKGLLERPVHILKQCDNPILPICRGDMYVRACYFWILNASPARSVQSLFGGGSLSGSLIFKLRNSMKSESDSFHYFLPVGFKCNRFCFQFTVTTYQEYRAE